MRYFFCGLLFCVCFCISPLFFSFLLKEKKLPPTASDHKLQVLILQLQLILFVTHNFNVMYYFFISKHFPPTFLKPEGVNEK